MPSSSTTPDRLALRAAMEAHDIDAAVAAFAPDAVLRSPLTDGLAFQGHEQIRAITQIVLDAFEGLRYTAEVHDHETALLVARARVAGEEIEIADHLRLDADGQIREMTVFFRPLPATAAALRVIGSELGRRRSSMRGAVIAGLTWPLGLLTRSSDGIGVKLIRRTL